MFAIVASTLLIYGIAHADPLVAVTPTGIDLSWQAWVAIGLAALGGIRAIVDALLAFFKAEAPLTKTTLDDHFRDSLQVAHDKLDRLAGAVNNLVDATRPPGGIRVVPGSGTVAMLVVLLLGAAGAGLMTSCTKAELGAAATSAEHAVVNCTGQAIGTTPALDLATLVAVANTVAAERAKCTPAGGSLDWKCVEADAIGEGKVLGGCTIVALMTGSPTSTPRLAAAAALDPGRAALDDFRARVAPGSTFHAATGNY